MKASKLVTIVVLVGLASMAAGGAATGWLLHRHGSPQTDSKALEIDTRAYKYINLEKVVIMLRSATGAPDPHYLALDLVFKTPTDTEAITREHLPLLRSVAVKALSSLTLQSASSLTIEELSRLINEAYSQTYAHDRAGAPFVEAMIGKLIIE
jgi:flagellar FliL protein